MSEDLEWEGDIFGFASQINNIEIQQIQMMVWDFFSAYKMGDKFRCGNILYIILSIAKVRPQLPTLQDYYKGQKISRHRGMISLRYAAQYIAFVGSECQRMADPRLKSEPID